MLYVQLLDNPRNPFWYSRSLSIRRCLSFPYSNYKEACPLGYLVSGVFYGYQWLGGLIVVMGLVCGYTNTASISILSSLFQVDFILSNLILVCLLDNILHPLQCVSSLFLVEYAFLVT
mgnify:CR=1 FL=1